MLEHTTFVERVISSLGVPHQAGNPPAKHGNSPLRRRAALRFVHGSFGGDAGPHDCQRCGRRDDGGASRADLLERFVVDEGNAGELRGQDFNVTPTKDNPVVIACIPDDAGAAADPVRELRAFRWGLYRSG